MRMNNKFVNCPADQRKTTARFTSFFNLLGDKPFIFSYISGVSSMKEILFKIINTIDTAYSVEA